MSINPKIKTEEQRLAYNAYMREFNRTHPQVKINHRKSQNARNARLRAADPIGYAKKKADETRRRRWLNHTAVKNEQIRYLYGEALDQREARLASQNGLCALCGRPFEDTHSGRASQDHDHKTGKLRDFLHARCNLALGNLLDDPALCRKAEEYLLRHKEAHDGTSGV